MNNKLKNILITGGAGFIGSALVRKIVKKKYNIINIDKLSYASDLNNLKKVDNLKNYKFINLDISNFRKLKKVFNKYNPQYVINCAAESHVDRSIANSKDFINSNIIGTYNLLECIRIGMQSKNPYLKNNFKLFHQVSTDEVYGDSEELKVDPDEKTSYNPSSPYSATKASSDHLVTAWARTFKIPFTISICTNNYGPFQFPEKLIPVIILNSLNGKKIPVYGDGKQIRDWLYVEDHVNAILKIVFNKKYKNQKFNISGNNQVKNIDLVKIICNQLNELVVSKPKNIKDFKNLIQFVVDRAGHDRKYALNSKKIKNLLNWKPKYNIDKGISLTLNWYLKNLEWCRQKI
jgi:dTDP-glucose 4,6-dehydratase